MKPGLLGYESKVAISDVSISDVKTLGMVSVVGAGGFRTAVVQDIKADRVQLTQYGQVSADY